MRRFLSVLLVGLLFFCTACTPTKAGSNGGADPTAQGGKELVACTTVTDKGLYSVEVYRAGIANIMYLDFATGQQVFLCNRPECKHHDESCNAYLSNEDGNCTPNILVAGDHLLLTRVGNCEKGPLKILIADLNGENRRTLCEFKSYQDIATEFYTDGDFLYFGLTTTNREELTQTESLVKVSLQTGQMDPLHTYPVNEVFHIFFGAYQNKLIVDEDWSDAAGKLWRSLYWLDTGKTDGDALSEEPFYTYQADERGPQFLNGCAYTTVEDSGIITEENMMTGQKRSWDCSAVAQNMVDYGGFSFGPLFDDYFVIYITKYDDTKAIIAEEYLLNLTDGSITLETLTRPDNGHPIAVEAVYQDSLCVSIDDWPLMFQFEDSEGMHEYESGTFMYAMIDKKDYIASNPNYRIIPAPTIPTGAGG